jgi:hypothetical protein
LEISELNRDALHNAWHLSRWTTVSNVWGAKVDLDASAWSLPRRWRPRFFGTYRGLIATFERRSRGRKTLKKSSVMS